MSRTERVLASLIGSLFLENCHYESPIADGSIALGHECQNTHNCPEGAVCYEGFCQQICDSALDCPSDLGCRNNICQSCEEDNHCQQGFKCHVILKSCFNNCHSNDDCPNDFICNDQHECIPLLPAGQDCQSANQCQSGNCSEGVCCQSNCSEECYSCNQEGYKGRCLPLPAGSLSKSCQGQSLECNTPNTSTITASCDGFGHCSANQAGLECFPYWCQQDNGHAYCQQHCQSDLHCQNGYRCVNNECIPLLSFGAPCLLDEQCKSGHCVDEVCCDSTCSKENYICNKAGAEGNCLPL